jgi:muconolactone D-isomerase
MITVNDLLKPARASLIPPQPARSTETREALIMEYLVTMTTRVPDGTPDQAVADVRAREAQSARALAGQGHLLRLWRLSAGGPGALGLWRARDAAEMQAIMESLPLYAWMTVGTTPLTPQPSDPVAAR